MRRQRWVARRQGGVVSARGELLGARVGCGPDFLLEVTGPSMAPVVLF